MDSPPLADPAGEPTATEDGRAAARRAHRWRWGLGTAAVLGLALAVWVWATRKPEEPTTDQDPFPLSPLASSPFLNTGPGARYVGSAACTSCHQDRHDSFCSTGMGRSMAAVDATR